MVAFSEKCILFVTKKAPSRSEKTPVVGSRRITIAVRKNRLCLTPDPKNTIASTNRDPSSLTDTPRDLSYLTTAFGDSAVAAAPPPDVTGVAVDGAAGAGAGGVSLGATAAGSAATGCALGCDSGIVPS